MEKTYLELLQDILDNGEERSDRTGVGTLSVFGRQLRCNLQDGFPLITTKKTHFKPILGELLWFLEGSSDERRLAEITYGTREPTRTTIWTANANADYWKPKAKFEGDLGRVYGVQWRRWEHIKLNPTNSEFGNQDYKITYIDQIYDIIHKLKTNPADRRMILTAFNVGELDQMALPPCHMFCQFNVNVKNNTLNCLLYLRSWDLFLGGPFNIASYATLIHMLSQITGYDPGELIISSGDTHIYLSHIDQVKEQLTRAPFSPPKLIINPTILDIDNFEMSDFIIENYQHHLEKN